MSPHEIIQRCVKLIWPNPFEARQRDLHTTNFFPGEHGYPSLIGVCFERPRSAASWLQSPSVCLVSPTQGNLERLIFVPTHETLNRLVLRQAEGIVQLRGGGVSLLSTLPELADVRSGKQRTVLL